jgi:hypothetical protein
VSYQIIQNQVLEPPEVGLQRPQRSRPALKLDPALLASDVNVYSLCVYPSPQPVAAFVQCDARRRRELFREVERRRQARDSATYYRNILRSGARGIQLLAKSIILNSVRALRLAFFSCSESSGLDGRLRRKDAT